MDHSTDNSDWRNKYFAALEQLEQLEQDGAEQAELLRRLLVRISLAADGQEPGLDRTLDQLRSALRNGGPLTDVQPQVDVALSEFDDFRGRNAEDLASALTRMASLLPQSQLPRPLRRELRGYLKQMGRQTDKIWLLPDLIEQLADIQQRAQLALREHKPSMIDRLKGQSPAPAFSGPPDELCQDVCEILQSLIANLAMDDESAVEAQGLMRELRLGLSWDNMVGNLAAVRDLLMRVHLASNRAFGDYLERVNGELTEIYSALEGASQAQVSRQATGETLHANVEQEMAGLSACVKDARDLNQLKTQVNTRLGNIRESLRRVRSTEEDQKALTGQLVRLAEQIQHMEREAESSRKTLQEQRHKALHDPLTTLPNREAYDERLALELQRWQRYGHPLTLVVCDVDHFKSINDQHGHLAGDRILKVIARELRKRLREVDFIARYGGEEFVILMPETDAEQAWHVMEDIRETLASAKFRFQGEQLQITLSAGLAPIAPADTAESLFERADSAMYRAKSGGRNRCCMADEQDVQAFEKPENEARQ
ncbi:GGDEF domain-containing protein [Marinimicrobium alkaliphilum]|uniref:GGDEF domain-containing protein n=1 Tax=Marinimicrobium alkaliphilum TaxID=2202654 RepID=UPI000DBAB9CE|nr:GGDEF domain-containing protein [Marinimicrobium alkaliphilum]